MHVLWTDFLENSVCFFGCESSLATNYIVCMILKPSGRRSCCQTPRLSPLRVRVINVNKVRVRVMNVKRVRVRVINVNNWVPEILDSIGDQMDPLDRSCWVPATGQGLLHTLLCPLYILKMRG